MSGYIFEIASSRTKLNKIDADTFKPFIGMLSASVISETNAAKTELAQDQFLDNLEDYGVDITDNRGIRFSEKSKRKYFKNRFQRLQTMLEDFTLERFAFQDPYDLRMVVENSQEDYVCLDGKTPIPVDRWVRTADLDSVYYVGKIISYK